MSAPQNIPLVEVDPIRFPTLFHLLASGTLEAVSLSAPLLNGAPLNATIEFFGTAGDGIEVSVGSVVIGPNQDRDLEAIEEYLSGHPSPETW